MARVSIKATIGKIFPQVEKELKKRAVSAAVSLNNSQKQVMRGGRHGRRHGGHRASAPGEPPAIQTRKLTDSFRPIMYGGDSMNAGIETPTAYAELLEGGTPGGQMKPRPFHDPILEKAKPKLLALYNKPFQIKL